MRVRNPNLGVVLVVLGLSAIFAMTAAVPSLAAAPVTAKPAVEAESVSGLTPFGVVFGGVVDPGNEATSYHFEYADSEAALVNDEGTSVGEGLLPGVASAETAVPAEIAGALMSNTVYYYRVVAVNAAGTATGEAKHFTTLTAEPPVFHSEGVSGLTSSSVTMQAQVKPNYQETTCEFQYGTDASLTTSTTVPCDPEHLGSVGCTPEEENVKDGETRLPCIPYATATFTLTGLKDGETYYYRTVAENETSKNKGLPADGAIESFTTLAQPVITAGEASSVTRTSTVFSGWSIDPVGAATSYHILYIDQAGYEAARSEDAANPYARGGSVPETEAHLAPLYTPQSALLYAGGLTPGTTYDYAIIATNSVGTTTSPNQSFTTAPPTPPLLAGNETTNVEQYAATISATINAQGLPTRWELRLGSTPGNLRLQAQGHTTSTTAEPLSANIPGLNAATTYHYKLVATNSDGTTETPETSFTTAPGPPAPTVNTTPLLTTPNIPFPTEETSTRTTTTTKTLTRAQKLAKALKTCHKQTKRAKRAKCENNAHKQYGPLKTKKQ